MSKSIALLATTWLGLSSLAQPAFAANPACESLGGAILFRDSLYGLGIGAILGGLGVAASEKTEKAGQVVAGTALAGTLFGLGFGIYEVGARDCNEPRPDQYNKNEYNFKSSQTPKAGLQTPELGYIPALASGQSSSWAMQMRYRF